MMASVEFAGGWVKVHRKILDSPIWTLTPAVAKVAIYFILRANYKSTLWYDGSRYVDVPAGTFITSYASAAAACNLSVQQVRDAFEHLERTQFATYRRTHRWTLVSVLNYETYQVTASDENTHENAQGTTDKEIKNKRKIKPCASPDGNAPVGELSSIDHPPFETTEPSGLFPLEPPAPTPPTRELTAEQESWFTLWWAEYWLRKAKKAAREAFRRHVKTAVRFEQVMTATRAQKPEMLSREASKRPHGATWLNGERWEDEITPAQPAAPTEKVWSDYPEYKPLGGPRSA
jgi:hypothetical protein